MNKTIERTICRITGTETVGAALLAIRNAFPESQEALPATLQQRERVLDRSVSKEVYEGSLAEYWYCDFCDAHLGDATQPPDHSRHEPGSLCGALAGSLASEKTLMGRVLHDESYGETSPGPFLHGDDLMWDCLSPEDQAYWIAEALREATE